MVLLPTPYIHMEKNRPCVLIRINITNAGIFVSNDKDLHSLCKGLYEAGEIGEGREQYWLPTDPYLRWHPSPFGAGLIADFIDDNADRLSADAVSVSLREVADCLRALFLKTTTDAQ